MSKAASAVRPNPLEGHARYEKLKDLNSGTFGFVQLAKDKQSGEIIAIKFIERGEKITKYVEREIINHRCLVHPHIIQYKEVFLTPGHLCIAMEYAPGGDMFEYVVKKNGLREDEARWFFQQLIVGLDYCHRMGVVNRDIKLENTLLDSSPRPLVKICDFGYSKIADIWSCGVMLYVMLVGAYPFERPEDKHDNQKLQKMIQRILHVDYHIPSHIKLSEDCKSLLSKILVADPLKRIAMNEIYDHPWYCKGLPPGVREMNDRPQAPPEGLQSVKDIEKIIEDARKVANGAPGTSAPQETDEYIETAMDDEGLYEEGSLEYD